MISAPGVGSGLDVNSIVQQLMAIERQPLNRLQADKKSYETQLSAYGQVKSALSTFQSAFADLKTLDAFEVYKATSADETAFTATANSSAAVSFSNIQVNRLAEANKMGSVAIADTDTTQLGGAGDQLTATINGKAFSVDIGGKTLAQIRDAINDAPDNTGVSATIISENSGSHRLVLTSIETGNDNALNLSFTGTVGADLGLTDINDRTQLDSELLIDGLYTVTRPGNTIDDAIGGVTLTLLGETTNPVKLTVDRDVGKVQETVQGFVDAYNTLKTTLDGLSGAGKDLQADNTLRSIRTQMQAVFNTPPTGLTTSLAYLSEVGVAFQRDGTLALDTGALESAINSDFSGVAELFAGEGQGYLARLGGVIDGFVQPEGLINIREDGLNTRIDTVDQRISDMQYRLDLRQQRLNSQFTALDELMGQLNGTSQFLTRQLASL
jgi:flagellar hook-associated protein 2